MLPALIALLAIFVATAAHRRATRLAASASYWRIQHDIAADAAAACRARRDSDRAAYLVADAARNRLVVECARLREENRDLRAEVEAMPEPHPFVMLPTPLRLPASP